MISYFTSRPPQSILHAPKRTYNFNIKELSADDPHRDYGYTHSAYPITVQASMSPSEALALVIEAYDKSNAVNGFLLNGKTEWIDNSTRMSVMNSTGIEKTAGYDTTTLWLGTQSYTMPCDLVISLLSAIEIYAKKCFNVTAEHQHKVAVLGDTFATAQDHYSDLLVQCETKSADFGSQATVPAASPAGTTSVTDTDLQAAHAAQQAAFEAILTYDFTVGYPDKLSINV